MQCAAAESELRTMTMGGGKGFVATNSGPDLIGPVMGIDRSA